MSSPSKKIDITGFLKLSSEYPVVDVRSPSEYRQGHIPGAVNIPLFDDRQRETVGTVYKKEGRYRAILTGLGLVAPFMAEKLNAGHNLADRNRLLVHCWRGGMRSEAMAWLFSLGDIETEILEGGYKSFRKIVLEELSEKRNYLVLGGLTGSGKTKILKLLAARGCQVIDLEGLACHKGSAFGSIGQPPQPSSEHFSNLLWQKLAGLDEKRIVWLEDESKNIGSVFLPDGFFRYMREAPVIALLMDQKTRIPRLLEDYATHSREELVQAVTKISKRLGGDNTRESIESIVSGNFIRAIEITLTYYDRTYLYGLKQRPESRIKFLETAADDVECNASMVLEAAREITASLNQSI